MIPMCIATPFSKHPQLRSPKGLPRRLEGTSASLEPPRARDVRVSRSNAKTWENGGAGDTAVSGQGHNGDGANEGQTQQWKRLHLLGKTKEHLPYAASARRLPLIRCRHARIRCEGSCGGLREAQARKEHSALRSAGSAFQKMSGTPTANFARKQIPLQLKPHR